MVGYDRGVRALGLSRGDETQGVEARVIELHVGAGPVREVYVTPKPFAVKVADLSVGVVGLFGSHPNLHGEVLEASTRESVIRWSKF